MPAQTVQITPDIPGSDAPVPLETSQERPAGLPEKFKDVDALVTAYGELERKLGGTPPAAATPPVETPPVDPAAPVSPEAAGFDMGALSKEYIENGNALKPETIAALAAKGVTPETVATYVAGAEATAKAMAEAMTAVAGSQEKVSAAYEWAKSNLPPADVKAYNDILGIGTPEAAKLAFEGLYTKYQAANGTEPALLQAPQAPAASGAAPYGSNAEVIAAMRDPRYSKDEAYRQSVARRLEVTEMVGIR